MVLATVLIVLAAISAGVAVVLAVIAYRDRPEHHLVPTDDQAPSPPPSSPPTGLPTPADIPLAAPTAAPSAPPAPPDSSHPPDDPRSLKAGDVVECGGTAFSVLGAMHMYRAGQSWVEFRLDDRRGIERWLSVEDRPSGLDLILWSPAPAEGMVPAQQTVLVDDVEYHLVERGTAEFQSEGETGHEDHGWLDFADYRSAKGRYLSFERMPGEQRWNASYGLTIERGAVRRLPGNPDAWTHI